MSIDIRRLVIIKFQDCWSEKKISMNLNIFKHGVQRNLTKFQEHKTLEDLQKSYIPQRSDNKCERPLIQYGRCHPKILHPLLISRNKQVKPKQNKTRNDNDLNI